MKSTLINIKEKKKNFVARMNSIGKIFNKLNREEAVYRSE